MTGLPFTNATATGIVSNIATVPVGYIDNFATGYSSVCDAPVNITTFTKPSSNTVDLTFNLYTGDGSVSTEGSNVSKTAMEKVDYQNDNNIQPGTPEWFRLWFSKPFMTG
jgi:hypothetical protein